MREESRPVAYLVDTLPADDLETGATWARISVGLCWTFS